MALVDFFTKVVGVDAGTSHLRISHQNKIVFDEPTALSVDTVANKVTGFGKSIKSGSNNLILKPVSYAVCDFHAFEMLLRGSIKQSVPSRSLLPPSLIFFWTVPSNVNEIEKRAYLDSAAHANGKEVYMLFQNCATAISLNILFEKKNFWLVDIGASKIEISIFNNSIPIASCAYRLGTQKIAQVLKNHFKKTHNLNISNEEIEEILESLSTENEFVKIQFKQFSLAGLKEVLDHYFYLLNDEVVQLYESITDRTCIDKAFDNGVFFTGGGSRFKYLRTQIMFDRKADAHVSKTPFHDNILGVAKVMANKEKFRHYLMT